MLGNWQRNMRKSAFKCVEKQLAISEHQPFEFSDYLFYLMKA
jgi:hypothetical protein